MAEKISSPVSIELFFDCQKRKTFVRSIVWQGKSYSIIKQGFYHNFRKGRVLLHVFSVASENLFFRLVLNSENLTWTLEEVSGDC